jgi:RNA polymerase sigma-70 factor (ECF subfamily)
MQDISIILWQKFTDYRPGSSFYSWAKAIARNKILQHREKFARRRHLLNSDAFAVTMEAYDAMEDELQERRGALRNCIEKLSVTDRELIVRRYHGQTTGRDLAKELGRPENSVYKSIGRIRKSLMACIRKSLSDGNPQASPA